MKMKGQFSVDYYVAIVVFIFFVVYLFFQLMKTIPTYLSEVNTQILKSEAYQISELLMNDFGEPQDWYNKLDSMDLIKRIGLSDELQKKTNLLSLQKINSLNTVCNSENGYNRVKSWINTEYNFLITLTDKITNQVLLSCSSEQEPAKTKIDVRRFVAFENSYGELILQLW